MHHPTDSIAHTMAFVYPSHGGLAGLTNKTKDSNKQLTLSLMCFGMSEKYGPTGVKMC